MLSNLWYRSVCGTRRYFHQTLKLRAYFNVQDEEDFEKRVVQSNEPVIVDFFANWCGPCKLLDPRLKAAVAEHEGKIILAKVDIDELQDLANRFKISAVPTVFSMKGGKVLGQFQGLVDEDKLKSFIKKAIEGQ